MTKKVKGYTLKDGEINKVVYVHDYKEMIKDMTPENKNRNSDDIWNKKPNSPDIWNKRPAGDDYCSHCGHYSEVHLKPACECICHDKD